MEERMKNLYAATKTDIGIIIYLKANPEKIVGMYNANGDIIEVRDYLNLPLQEYVSAIIKADM